MSWHIEFNAASDVAAVETIDEQAKNLGTQFPQDVVDLVKTLIDTQPKGVPLFVKTNGHVGGTSSQSVHIDVYPLQIVAEKPKKG
jgi:hypothetical protein